VTGLGPGSTAMQRLSPPILLCALDYRDAQLFAQDHELPWRQVWYVSDIYKLRGITPERVAVTGRFDRRRGAAEIWAMLRYRADRTGLTLPDWPVPGIYTKEA
jgi:hypothetical protein